MTQCALHTQWLLAYIRLPVEPYWFGHDVLTPCWGRYHIKIFVSLTQLECRHTSTSVGSFSETVVALRSVRSGKGGIRHGLGRFWG